MNMHHRLVLSGLRCPLLANCGRTSDKLIVDISPSFSRGFTTVNPCRLGENSITKIFAISRFRGTNLVNGSSLNSINHCRPHNFQACTNKFWLYTATRLTHTSGGDNNFDRKEVMLPPLMPFPAIVWPRFINAIRNWFFIHFIIKPYFDKEFSMNDFMLGVRQAVSTVANKLSEGKLEELEGLVDASALSQIKESLSNFTVFQQQLLRVAAEDVFFAFPYQIGIIIPDEAPRDQSTEGRQPQTRHVEITVCLHVLRGLAEKQRSGETGATFNFQEVAQDERNKYNVMICNYRFFKDFTEGCPDPSWIVNMVNHFLPAEMQKL